MAFDNGRFLSMTLDRKGWRSLSSGWLPTVHAMSIPGKHVCGPGGSRAPTGKILSHDRVTGQDTVVDLTPSAAASRIYEVRDAWY